MATIPSNVQQGPFGPGNNTGRTRAQPQPVVLLKGPAQGREHTDTRELDAIQQRVADASSVARANPLGASNFFQNVACVSGTPVTLQHGLGRAFVSALVTGQSAAGNWSIQRASTPWRPQTTQNLLDERVLVFTPLFTGTCDVLVW